MAGDGGSLFVLHSREKGFKWLAAELKKREIRHSGTFSNAASEGCAPTVILWGRTLQEPPGVPILNRLACVLRASHAESVKELLELNGIKSEAGTDRGKPGYGPFTREFRVPVFQQDALALFERKPEGAQVGRLSAVSARDGASVPYVERMQESAGSSFCEIPLREAAFHGRRAMREAVKAVYALGLDFALVTLGTTVNAHTAVIAVDPVPPLDEALAHLFAEAFARFAEAEQGERSDGARLERNEGTREGERVAGERVVVLGADPEFILLRPDGRVASASRYLERGGAVGSDGVVLPERRVIRPLVELRPQPCAEPLRLAGRLRRCMLQAQALIRDPSLAWVAGGMPVPGLALGGHIHFSGIALNSALLRALDGYLALPALLLESAEDRRRRPRYGALGDCRRKNHGGFEYRTLSSWLGTPRIAAGVLSLAALVAGSYRRLTRQPLLQADMQRLFYAGGRERLQDAARPLWRELEALPAYARYRRELDALKAELFQSAPPAGHRDFRAAWKIDSAAAAANAAPTAAPALAPGGHPHWNPY